jgi:hypothetical protein
MIKSPGGTLTPASDIEAEKLTALKTGELYNVEIKRHRNPQFHRKVFEFMNFCFHHWKSDREFMNEPAQFDVFRKNLTVIAGYYDEFYTISGSVRIEAKSLAYSSMSQEEFEDFYSALIAAAMRTIFKDCGKNIEEKLISFF